MSTSHYSRRADGADVIQPAFLTDPDRPENLRRFNREAAFAWMILGCVLLIFDGLALAHFADSVLEAVVWGLLCMPTSIFIVCAALEARK
jgi:hypothetical protein